MTAVMKGQFPLSRHSIRRIFPAPSVHSRNWSSPNIGVPLLLEILEEIRHRIGSLLPATLKLAGIGCYTYIRTPSSMPKNVRQLRLKRARHEPRNLLPHFLFTQKLVLQRESSHRYSTQGVLLSNSIYYVPTS